MAWRSPTGWPVDVVAEPIRLGVGEGAVDGSQHEANKHVLLGLAHPEPHPGGLGEVLVARLGDDGDLFEHVGPVAEGVSDSDSQLLGELGRAQ